MSVREVEKSTRYFLRNHYLEPIQYVLKTENIFPLDFNDGKKRELDALGNSKADGLDMIEVHPDRVIRQELFTNFDKPVKTDLKKHIPGQFTRHDYLGLQQRIVDEEERNDLVDLERLSQKLQYDNIKTIVGRFENLEEIPLSSR